MSRATDYSESLSPRELEVLKLYAKGYTRQEIADELYIDKKTVSMHAWRILQKLESPHNMRLAIYKSYQQGIIEPPSTKIFHEELLNRARIVVGELEERLKY